MSSIRRVLAVVAGFMLAATVVSGCGDDAQSDNADDVAKEKSQETDTYRGETITFQEVEFDGVQYNCLMAGYYGYPAMWCERDNSEVVEP